MHTHAYTNEAQQHRSIVCAVFMPGISIIHVTLPDVLGACQNFTAFELPDN